MRRGGTLVARLLAAGLLLGVAAACGDLAGFETPRPPSGIRGTVILGPTCATGQSPGAFEPVPCLTPYAANLAILDENNVVVMRVAAGADGHFEATLPPGEYVVAPEGGDPYPIAQPIPVVVTPGEYIEIQINYDTGIR